VFEALLVGFVLVEECDLFVEGLALLADGGIVDVFERLEAVEADGFLDGVEGDGLGSLGGEEGVQVEQLLAVVLLVGVLQADQQRLGLFDKHLDDG